MERNEHHVWWERRQYRSELEKKLRNHRGFVIPIDVLDHKALHAELDPGPPKPNKLQAEALLSRIGHFALEPGARLKYINEAVEFFIEQIGQPDHLGDNAEAIAQHLMEQIIYIQGEYDGIGEISGRE